MQINKEGKRQSYGNKNNCRKGCRTGEESRISVTGPPSANERIRHRDPTRASLCLLFSFSPLLGSRSRIRPILWKCRAQSRVFAIKMLNASRRVPQNVGFNGSEDARDPLKFARESFFLPASTSSRLTIILNRLHRQMELIFIKIRVPEKRW